MEFKKKGFPTTIIVHKKKLAKFWVDVNVLYRKVGRLIGEIPPNKNSPKLFKSVFVFVIILKSAVINFECTKFTLIPRV